MTELVNRPRAIVACLGMLILLTGCSRGVLLPVPGRTVTPGQEAYAVAVEVTGTLSLDGSERSYRLHAPADYDPSVPVALVVALHGGGGNGANLQATVGLDAIADREGFLVVYPDGNGRLEDALLTWNVGNCCGYALDLQVDDVAFIRALVGHLAMS